jgi:hypothetical protein
MNARFAIAAISLLTIAWSGAQNVPPEQPEDPIQEAIRNFNQRDTSKPNEVSVVLDPVGVPPAPVDEAAKEEAETSAEPVLVTGKPQEGTELVTEEAQPDTTPAVEETTPQPQKGMAVRVEKIQAGNGNIDPAKVKLLAPFPAKPLGKAPAGWRLEAAANAPPFTREIELSPGKKITLTVRPHLLVPEADGADAFSVQEPGFDSSLGYRQNATVGAVLSESVQQLDKDSKHMGAAIDQLQQLLISLPKPEAPPEIPQDLPKPANTRKR